MIPRLVTNTRGVPRTSGPLRRDAVCMPMARQLTSNCCQPGLRDLDVPRLRHHESLRSTPSLAELRSRTRRWSAATVVPVVRVGASTAPTRANVSSGAGVRPLAALSSMPNSRSRKRSSVRTSTRSIPATRSAARAVYSARPYGEQRTTSGRSDSPVRRSRFPRAAACSSPQSERPTSMSRAGCRWSRGGPPPRATAASVDQSTRTITSRPPSTPAAASSRSSTAPISGRMEMVATSLDAAGAASTVKMVPRGKRRSSRRRSYRRSSRCRTRGGALGALLEAQHHLAFHDEVQGLADHVFEGPPRARSTPKRGGTARRIHPG